MSRYDWSATGANGERRGVEYFKVLRSTLGPDCLEWHKHHQFHIVSEMCHKVIFGREDEYNPRGGMLARVSLIKANRIDQRVPDELEDAFDAGVLSYGDLVALLKR